MKIIGLTGLTGAGKSTVAQKLMAYGCYHIDADKVAREVINNNENVKGNSAFDYWYGSHCSSLRSCIQDLPEALRYSFRRTEVA